MSATRREFRPVINETGCGLLWGSLVRADFKDGNLPAEYEFVCLDAPATISTGAHFKNRDGWPLAGYEFR